MATACTRFIASFQLVQTPPPLPATSGGAPRNRCQSQIQTTRLPSAADCPCHAVYAGCAEFCEVRLQTSFNSAAARFHASAHRSDIATAFARNRRRPDQYGLARPGEVREMRVKAGPDAARARRHVSTCRPDISGTFPCDLSLLRHRVCRREQHDGTDCKNNLLHRLVLPDVLTCCVQSPRADVQSLAHSCRSEPGDLVSQTRCHRWLRAAHGLLQLC